MAVLPLPSCTLMGGGGLTVARNCINFFFKNRNHLHRTYQHLQRRGKFFIQLKSFSKKVEDVCGKSFPHTDCLVVRARRQPTSGQYSQSAHEFSMAW